MYTSGRSFLIAYTFNVNLSILSLNELGWRKTNSDERCSHALLCISVINANALPILKMLDDGLNELMERLAGGSKLLRGANSQMRRFQVILIVSRLPLFNYPHFTSVKHHKYTK
jgi:hypothetical protein